MLQAGNQGRRSASLSGQFSPLAGVTVTYLNRWAQPDSIIPDPSNPLDFDRYSYVRNNPVKYTDPSGHYSCSDMPWEECENKTTQQILEEYYGVTIDDEFTEKQKGLIYQAVSDVGQALARASEYITGADAFVGVYKYMKFIKCTAGGSNCKPSSESEQITAGMITLGSHKIGIATFSAVSDLRSNNNIVHELGHAFDNIMNEAPVTWVGWWQSLRPIWVRQPGDRQRDYGFYRGEIEWSVALTDNLFGSPGEEFADMFLGWVYGRWSTSRAGRSRSLFMNHYMPGWINGTR